MWFEQLVGFRESTPAEVRAQLTFEGEFLTSNVTGRKMRCGTLLTPTLDELLTLVSSHRNSLASNESGSPQIKIREVVADVQALHRDPGNAGATFQVASQFNLLEMVSPQVTPEFGIDIYESDATQGPACAIACGAGTVYRQYLVPIENRLGQSCYDQLDMLRDVGNELGNQTGQLWEMKNGYVIPRPNGLERIADRLNECSEADRAVIAEQLRVGWHRHTQVTLGQAKHSVSQVYCSALPVAYSKLSPDSWQPFAQLVLDAAYRATFATAAIQLAESGNSKLFLTLLGGGAFGNRMKWILDAIQRSLGEYQEWPLDVAIVSYGKSNRDVQKMIQRFYG